MDEIRSLAESIVSQRTCEIDYLRDIISTSNIVWDNPTKKIRTQEIRAQEIRVQDTHTQDIHTEENAFTLRQQGKNNVFFTFDKSSYHLLPKEGISSFMSYFIKKMTRDEKVYFHHSQEDANDTPAYNWSSLLPISLGCVNKHQIVVLHINSLVIPLIISTVCKSVLSPDFFNQDKQVVTMTTKIYICGHGNDKKQIEEIVSNFVRDKNNHYIFGSLTQNFVFECGFPEHFKKFNIDETKQNFNCYGFIRFIGYMLCVEPDYQAKNGSFADEEFKKLSDEYNHMGHMLLHCSENLNMSMLTMCYWLLRKGLFHFSPDEANDCKARKSFDDYYVSSLLGK